MTTTTLVFVTTLVVTAINLVIFGFVICEICNKTDDYDELDKRLDKIEHDLQSIRSRENFFDRQDLDIRVRLLTGLLTMMKKGGAQ